MARRLSSSRISSGVKSRPEGQLVADPAELAAHVEGKTFEQIDVGRRRGRPAIVVLQIGDERRAWTEAPTCSRLLDLQDQLEGLAEKVLLFFAEYGS